MLLPSNVLRVQQGCALFRDVHSHSCMVPKSLNLLVCSRNVECFIESPVERDDVTFS